jgi:hypothetical protein
MGEDAQPAGPRANLPFSRSFGGNEGDGTLAGEGRGGAKPLRGESASSRAL